MGWRVADHETATAESWEFTEAEAAALEQEALLAETAADGSETALARDPRSSDVSSDAIVEALGHYAEGSAAAGDEVSFKPALGVASRALGFGKAAAAHVATEASNTIQATRSPTALQRHAGQGSISYDELLAGMDARARQATANTSSALLGGAGGGLNLATGVYEGLGAIDEGENVQAASAFMKAGKGAADMASAGHLLDLQRAARSADELEYLKQSSKTAKALKYGAGTLGVLADGLTAYDKFADGEVVDGASAASRAGSGLMTMMPSAALARYGGGSLGLVAGGLQMYSGLEEGLEGDANKGAEEMSMGALSYGTSVATLAGAGAAPVAAAALAGYAGYQVGEVLRDTANEVSTERKYYGDTKHKGQTYHGVEAMAMDAGHAVEDFLPEFVPDIVREGAGATTAGLVAIPGTVATYGVLALDELGMIENGAEFEERAERERAERQARRDEGFAAQVEQFGADAVSEKEYEDMLYDVPSALLSTPVGTAIVNARVQARVADAEEMKAAKIAAGEWSAEDEEWAKVGGVRTLMEAEKQREELSARPETQAAYQQYQKKFGEHAVSLDEFVTYQQNGATELATEAAQESMVKQARWHAHAAIHGEDALSWAEYKKTSPKKAERMVEQQKAAMNDPDFVVGETP